MNNIDALIRRNTGFVGLADMLNAAVNYRPSLDMREAWAREVADAYDAAQEARGDARRAYRYAQQEADAMVAKEAARVAQEAERVAREERKAKAAAATVGEQDFGRVYANQGKRDARVLARAEGRVLIEYDMPAGRSFLWDVAESVKWSTLCGDNDERVGIRNVSANRPPKMWRAALAEIVGGAA